MIYDVVPPDILSRRHHIRKLIESMPFRGGVIGGTAYLIIYNEKQPELTRIIVEQLESQKAIS